MNQKTWYGALRPKMLTKLPDAEGVYTFSFIGMLPAASSIVSVSPIQVTPDATAVPLVCELGAIVNHTVKVRISAGTAGATYYLRVTAMTSDAEELLIEGYLFIEQYGADVLADGAAILVLPAFTMTATGA